MNEKILNNTTWIEASAGSGKTKTLIDRIISLLLCGVRPGSILCIAFTNAAASEMQLRLRRIADELCEAGDEKVLEFIASLGLEGSPDELMQKCRALYDTITEESVQIQTIHSFCLSLIKQFGGDISNFEKLADEDQLSRLLDDAVNRVITGKDEDPLLSSAIKFLGNAVDVMSMHNLLNDQKRCKDQYSAIFAHGLDKLIVKCAEFFSLTTDEILGDVGTDRLDSTYVYLSRNINELCEEFLMELKDDANPKNEKLVAKLNECLPLLRENLEEFLSIFLTQKETVKKTIVSKSPDGSYQRIAPLMNKLCTHITYGVEYGKKLLSAKLAFSATLFCAHVISAYEELKREAGLTEYDDILLKAREILTSAENDWVRFNIDSDISHILVDEAQDVNQIQWEIIRLLTEDIYSGESHKSGRSLFVVGDVKQSIYSFQGADPQHFLEMKDYFEQKTFEAKIEMIEVQKNTSYRSTKTILNFVDHVFGESGLEDSLLIGAPLKHEASRFDRSSEIEIWPIEKEEERNFPRNWEPPVRARKSDDPAVNLAQKIARTIRNKIAANLYIPSKRRNMQPGDVLILFQRRNDFMLHVLRALKSEDLPVAGIDKIPFTDYLAIQDVLSVIRFVLFPYDNLNLATLLKSPFFSMTENDLLKICVDSSFENTIFNKLSKSNPKIHTQLSRWIKISNSSSVAEFLCKVIEPNRRNLTGRLGKEVDDLLDSFIAKAYEFEKTETCVDLMHFLYYIRSKKPQSTGAAATEVGNEIRLMTVHASKGLQAPCVILADANFYNIRTDNSVWRDIMLFYPNITNIPVELLSVREEEVAKRRREYFRLLYVGMTRAQDALYIAGLEYEKTSSPSCWYNMILAAAKKRHYNSVFDKTFDGYILKIGSLQKTRGAQTKPPAAQKDLSQAALARPNIRKPRARAIGQATESTIIRECLLNFGQTSDSIEKLIDSSCKKFGVVAQNKLALAEKLKFAINNPNASKFFGSTAISNLSFVFSSEDGHTRIGLIDKLVVSGDDVELLEIRPRGCDAALDHRLRQKLAASKKFLQNEFPNAKVQCNILLVEIGEIAAVDHGSELEKESV